jgi:polysaccharide biosynthesis protein PelG
MAGIGFVLQKVLREGGMGSFFKVAIAGTIIVAGPWLLSIIGIFALGRISGSAIEESRGLFMAVIIYSYAFSLIIFGGFHYIFTRQVADYIFEKKRHEAGSALVVYSLFIIIFASGISYAAMSTVDLGFIRERELFRLSSVLLFTTINLIWILMIFISLLKKYILIFLVYLAGMVGSIAGVSILGNVFASGGAMLGFAAGQGIVVVLLFFLSFIEYPPTKFLLIQVFRYFAKFRFLFLAGLFYYWGMWADKVVFWFTNGTPVTNSFFHVFDPYDIPVYLANLTMIPGLIYFIIVSETDFYSHLTEFLKTLHSSIYKNIQIRKAKVVKSMRNGLKEQAFFQGLFTMVFVLLSPIVSKTLFEQSINPIILSITTCAVFFHLMLLTIVVFLFYLQLYKHAFFATFSFFVINLAGSFVIAFLKLPYLYGTSYLAGAAVAALVGGIFLNYYSKRFDSLIYYSAAEGI